METTERIVEAYVRYVKGWATIPNVHCAGQNEIDLIAIDPKSLDRYHIEVSISISQGFRRLTAKPFDPNRHRERVHQAEQRRTIGFFRNKKFGSDTVVEKLREFGFKPGGYRRVIVSWGWNNDALEEAEAAGIELWDFRSIIHEIADVIRGSRQYFRDDTLRTLNLFIHADDEKRREIDKPVPRTVAAPAAEPRIHSLEGYWVYENWTHKYAAIHRAACSFCNDGRGVHAGSSNANGQWLGPFDSSTNAMGAAQRTGQSAIRPCGVCSPVDVD